MKQRNNRMMITPRSIVNLQKLTVAQLVKKFTAVYAIKRLKSTNFWYVTPCRLVKVQRRFGRTCWVHLRARRESRTCESVFLLQVSCLAYSSTSTMEVVCSSETSVMIHRITWHDILEDNILHGHLCENLKSNSPKVHYCVHKNP
jgi:hypothetical protein